MANFVVKFCVFCTIDSEKTFACCKEGRKKKSFHAFFKKSVDFFGEL